MECAWAKARWVVLLGLISACADNPHEPSVSSGSARGMGDTIADARVSSAPAPSGATVRDSDEVGQLMDAAVLDGGLDAAIDGGLDATIDGSLEAAVDGGDVPDAMPIPMRLRDGEVIGGNGGLGGIGGIGGTGGEGGAAGTIP